MRTHILTSMVLLATLAGCSFAARSADMYSKDTRELLTTRNAKLKECYEAEREKDDTLQGKVVVAFKVETDTGSITSAKVVEDATTAPEPLQQCVLSSLEGLTLEPADARDGEATFTWEFAAE